LCHVFNAEALAYDSRGFTSGYLLIAASRRKVLVKKVLCFAITSITFSSLPIFLYPLPPKPASVGESNKPGL
jgi:hypothetical protein